MENRHDKHRSQVQKDFLNNPSSRNAGKLAGAEAQLAAHQKYEKTRQAGEQRKKQNSSQDSQDPAPSPSYSQNSRPSEKSVWDALGRKAPHGGGYEEIDTIVNENSSARELFCEGRKCWRSVLNRKKATYWFTLSAEKGDPEAQCMLGRILYNSDQETAISLFIKSAKSGHWDAKYEVAILHVMGKGVQRDLDKAYNLMKEACVYFEGAKYKKSLKLLEKIIKAERKQNNTNAKIKAEIFQSQLIIEYNNFQNEFLDGK